MHPIFSRSDIRISLLYFLAASLWIIGSDTLVVKLLLNNPVLSENLNIFKGLGFVVVTTVLLYLLLRRELLLRLDKETTLESEIQRARSYHAELENSEKRFRKAIEEAPLPIIIIAEDGEVLSISQTWLDITGYTREQLKTLDSWTELAYGERRQGVRAGIDRLFELTSRVDEGEFTIRCADGTPRIWAFSSTPLGRSSDGRRVAISIATDMTAVHQNAQLLHESEYRFSHIFHASPVATVLTHLPDGRFVDVNEAMEMLTGYSSEELRGKTSLEVGLYVNPDVRPQLAERMQRTGSYKNIDAQLKDKAGAIHDLLLSAELIALGGEKYAITMAHDITDRRRAEATLRESEERYRLLVEQAADGIFVADQQGRYVQVNHRGCEMLGYTLDEMLNLKLSDLVPAEDLATAPIQLEALRAGKIVTAERRLRRKDGSLLPVEISARILLDGRMQGIVHDLTWRKQVEGNLRYQANLIESVSDAIISTDLQFVIRSWNKAAEELYGWSPAEVIGKPLTEVILTRYPDSNGAEVLAQFRSAGVWRGEVIQLHRDGTPIDILSSVSLALDSNGTPIGAVGINRDIRERKMAEEKLRVSEALFSSAFHVGPAGMTITRIADGKFIDVNESFCSMFEFNRAEVIGHTSTELSMWSPEERKKLIQQQLESGGLHNFELIARSKSGRLINVLFSSKEMLINGETCHLTTLIDITERKRIEEAKQRLNQRLTILHQIDRDIIAALSTDKIVGTVVKSIQQLISCEQVTVTLFDDSDTDGIIFSVSTNNDTVLDSRLRVSPKSDPHTEILKLGQVMLIQDTANVDTSVSSIDEALINQGFRSLLVTPLLLEGDLIGTISLASRTPNFFTPEHEEILQEVAGQIAIALQSAALRQSLEKKNQQLQTLSTQLVEAQEIERRHIARELHDEVGQTLTALSLMLNEKPQQGGVSSKSPDIQEAQALVSELTGRIRELSLDLRPSMLDDLGLIPTLVWYFKRYEQQTDITIDFKYGDVERRFPVVVETTLFRIIQEALTNVARHAQVKRAAVRLWTTLDAIHTQIEDTGNGFDLRAVQSAKTTGGILGLRERAQIAGGTCEIESSIGEGTSITVRIPLYG